MESKEIYRLFNQLHTFSRVQNIFNDKKYADTHTHNEYNYLGESDTFQKDNFEKMLSEFFGNVPLYVGININKSYLAMPTELTPLILPYVGKKDIQIMNQEMTKIVIFNGFGSFTKGHLIHYPKSRERKQGTPLQVEFYANIYENKYKKVSYALDGILPKIKHSLCQDYGGTMEHLWVDLLLVEHRKPFNFRFQKRVNDGDFYYNVGHYTAVPDFKLLDTLNDENEIRQYVLTVFYQSTKILEKKSKQLGGFNAKKFREEFKSACQALGFILNDDT